MSFIISVLSITGLMFMWWVVQKHWKKTFHEYTNATDDEDVLANRRSCSDCGCTTACIRKSEAKTTGFID